MNDPDDSAVDGITLYRGYTRQLSALIDPLLRFKERLRSATYFLTRKLISYRNLISNPFDLNYTIL